MGSVKESHAEMTDSNIADSIDFVVSKQDLRCVDFVPQQPAADVKLKSEEVLLRVDRFGLTSNNVGYAALGDAMDYWSFFPAQEGWGRIPVWGFADVIRSHHNELREGERLYGYLPMSTHLVVPVRDVSAASFTDASAHRAGKAPVYNRYLRLGADPSYDRSKDGTLAIFRPLFTTAFLLDDFLSSKDFFGARSVILSSASSKTALGLAFLLSELKGNRCTIVGLTSEANRSFVSRTGYYDAVYAYDELETVPSELSVTFIDFAGDASIVERTHRYFGANLVHSSSVGISHWERTGPNKNMPGPIPTFFSAPTYGNQRVAEWGMMEFQKRTSQAMRKFLNSTDAWLQIVERNGRDAVASAYRATLDGKANPAEGYLLSLHTPNSSAASNAHLTAAAASLRR